MRRLWVTVRFRFLCNIFGDRGGGRALYHAGPAARSGEPHRRDAEKEKRMKLVGSFGEKTENKTKLNIKAVSGEINIFSN